jgi:hypothetical protein
MDVKGLTLDQVRKELDLKPIESVDEIKEKYPGEWVILGNSQFEIVAGEVLFHTKNREELEKELERYGPPTEAHYYYVLLCNLEE